MVLSSFFSSFFSYFNKQGFGSLMFTEKRVLLLTFLVRLVIPLVLPTASANLQNSVTLSTLISSFKSLQEGVFLYSNNINIYDGGVVHHAPIFVFVMSWLIDSSSILYPLIDTIIVYYLMQIAKILNSNSNLQSFKNKLSPEIIGILFALNPLSILSNIAKSTVSFNNLFIILAFYYSLINNLFLSSISISIASYLSFSPVYLIFPLFKINSELNNSNFKFILYFISAITTLLFTSYYLSNQSWEFLYSTYGNIITFNKIAPNLGLWWYYFTEMFEFFIPFYIAVFNVFHASLAVPFSLRLNGVFAYILTLGWLIFTKQYSELGDLSLYLSLLLLLQPVFKYLTYFIISGLLLTASIVLAPLFYHLWIDLGSGNSNFFYAITLVYNLGISSTIADFTWGYLVQEYHLSNKNKNIDKKISQL